MDSGHGDGYTGDMPDSKHITESTILDFLEGTGTGDERLDAVLDAMAALPPAPDAWVDLIARITAVASESASIPSVGAGASHSKPLPPRWRRRAVFSTVLSSVAGKIAIAGVALATTAGGLAAADSLPAPAQQAVSDAAAHIGISLPAPDDTLDQNDQRVAPELPDGASHTAGRVIEFVFGGDPQFEGAEFGRRVAEIASDGNSQGGAQGENKRPEGVPGGPPDQIPAGPPSDQGGGTPASPSSPSP